MTRITIKDLEQLVAVLNNTTGHALQPYTRSPEGVFTANVGTYYLDGAYGGYKLAQIANEGGGQSDISTIGYASKRELYNWITAYLRGIQAA